MKELGLQLNGKSYDYEHLQSGSFAGPLSDFEKATLEFCHQWISGQSSFTVATSGSTGTPKPIVLSREAMEVSARMTKRVLGLKEGDHTLLCLDTRFIAGKMMLVRSFVTGMQVIAVEPTANPFNKIPEQTQIDFVALVPHQLQAILESSSGIQRLNKLKAILVGGAALNQRTKAMLQDATCPVYATYGMTETITHIALQRLNGPHPQDYFKVLPGVSISKDERGCLVVGAAHLQPSRIVTNDLINLLSPERFQWLGRYDHVINSGGIKVIPERIEKEIEKILVEMGLDNRFFVTGIPDERLGNKVVLILEGIAFSSKQQEDMLVGLVKVLSKYEIPKEVRFIEQFLETDTKKVDRRATASMGKIN